MNDIKKFWDDLSLSGYGRPRIYGDFASTGCGYPAVAFICASTELFYEEQLPGLNPALFDRWGRDECLYLERPSKADIDFLTFRLRELFFLAGKSLPPISNGANGTHEVTEVRDSVLHELEKNAMNAPVTMRRIIQNLIVSIDNHVAG